MLEFLSVLAMVLPLLDGAVKDKNYKQVKYYQSLIDANAQKYQIDQAMLNKALSKYQNKYNYAVNSLYGTVRGGAQQRKAEEAKKRAKEGIESTQAQLSESTSKYEQANQAIRETQRQYENKGLIESIGSGLSINVS